MPHILSNNVFSGPNALKDYYNPDRSPPLPLVELPPHLNPFHDDGVRIYAKMMTFLPAHNVKELPALAMLSSPDFPPQAKSLVEYSSGSTVISMGIVARVLYGINDTKAYISNKTSESKLRLLQFFGLDLRLFGGPSQPEPTDSRGGIQRARQDAAQDNGMVNLNQYENDLNWGAHLRWTGPQILSQLPSLSVLCAGMGTAGTLTGTATYMKRTKPTVVTVGVCTAPGDRVPGPRSYGLLAPVDFPWRNCVDAIVDCGSEESFTASLHLTRNGIVCGPSSGFNLVGLTRYLQGRKDEGTLGQLRDGNGLIDCVFLCCDLPYQYISEYFDQVPQPEFHPIKDAHLTSVDIYRYDDAWELDSQSSQLKKICQGRDSMLLDLRSELTGDMAALPNTRQTLHVPIQTLRSCQPSPFFDSSLLEQQWKELAEAFDRKSHTAAPYLSSLVDNTVVVVCHRGDTARMATSILRANGIEAWSVKGGIHAMDHEKEQLKPVDSPMNESLESSPVRM